jgi:hypothetical protein
VAIVCAVWLERNWSVTVAWKRVARATSGLGCN